jgi:hypothetical protein
LANHSSAHPLVLDEQLPPERRRRQDHLPAIGGMRGSLDQAPLLEPGDDPGHGGWLDPLRLGQFPRGEGPSGVEALQGRDLRDGELADRAGLPQAPVDPRDGVPELDRELGRAGQIHGGVHGCLA